MLHLLKKLFYFISLKIIEWGCYLHFKTPHKEGSGANENKKINFKAAGCLISCV